MTGTATLFFLTFSTCSSQKYCSRFFFLGITLEDRVWIELPCCYWRSGTRSESKQIVTLFPWILGKGKKEGWETRLDFLLLVVGSDGRWRALGRWVDGHQLKKKDDGSLMALSSGQIVYSIVPLVAEAMRILFHLTMINAHVSATRELNLSCLL